MTETTLLDPQAANQEQDAILIMLRSAYESYVRAMKRRDLSTIMAMLAHEFSWTLPDGSVLNRAQTEAAFVETFRTTISIDEMDISLQLIDCKETQVAVLLNENSMGLIDMQGDRYRFRTRETIQEVWIKTEDAWKIRAATVVQSQTLTLPMDAPRS